MTGRGAGVLVVLLATACGGSTLASNGTPGAGGAAGSDAGIDATTGGSAGSAGSPGFDAGGGDAPYNPWADSGAIDAGVFDCDGVCCDGTTHYCRIVYGGAAPIFGTPPEAGLTCSDAGTSTRCVPLPSQCVGAPSCACIAKYSVVCGQCDSTGGGVTVTCYAP